MSSMDPFSWYGRGVGFISLGGWGVLNERGNFFEILEAAPQNDAKMRKAGRRGN